MTDDIQDNLKTIKSHLVTALTLAGRRESDCALVAVSKTKSAETIQSAIDAGQRIFGENKIQEVQQKWPALRKDNSDLRVHFIGPVQSNKVRQAVLSCDVIETVDREKLAQALARIMKEENTYPDLYVQVNTGDEPQKAGVSPKDLAAFLDVVKNKYALKIVGLMCIPPADETAALHFSLLKKLATSNGIEKLSMGMSEDYEVAAQLGATSVRVGSAIFGARGV